MGRAIMILAVTLALTVPAVAGAAADPVKLAVAHARTYWGATPCAGDIKVQTRQALPAGLARPSSAWATFDTSAGSNDLAMPASSYTNCSISLARWRWPTTKVMRADWDMLCLTVVHEYGHLLGHAHDQAPGSIMAAVFTDLSAEPVACKTKRPGTPK